MGETLECACVFRNKWSWQCESISKEANPTNIADVTLVFVADAVQLCSRIVLLCDPLFQNVSHCQVYSKICKVSKIIVFFFLLRIIYWQSPRYKWPTAPDAPDAPNLDRRKNNIGDWIFVEMLRVKWSWTVTPTRNSSKPNPIYWIQIFALETKRKENPSEKEESLSRKKRKYISNNTSSIH